MERKGIVTVPFAKRWIVAQVGNADLDVCAVGGACGAKAVGVEARLLQIRVYSVSNCL